MKGELLAKSVFVLRIVSSGSAVDRPKIFAYNRGFSGSGY